MRSQLSSELWGKTFCDEQFRVIGGKIGLLRTTQPVPTTLHVSSESRVIGLHFYKLSFGTVGEPRKSRWKNSHTLNTLPIPARVYYNFRSDRLCPMGTFTKPYILKPPQESGLRFAINIYRKWAAEYRGKDWGMGHIEEILSQVHQRPLEICLYSYEDNTLSQYAGRLAKRTISPGEFDFVYATQ